MHSLPFPKKRKVDGTRRGILGTAQYRRRLSKYEKFFRFSPLTKQRSARYAFPATAAKTKDGDQLALLVNRDECNQLNSYVQHGKCYGKNMAFAMRLPLAKLSKYEKFFRVAARRRAPRPKHRSLCAINKL